MSFAITVSCFTTPLILVTSVADSLLLKDAWAYEDGPDRRKLVKRLCLEELAAGPLGS
jgi:hypothetical protein